MNNTMNLKMGATAFAIIAMFGVAGSAFAMEMTGDSMMKKDDAMMQKEVMVKDLMKKVEALQMQITKAKENMMQGDAMMKKDDAMMKKDEGMMKGDAMMKKGDAMTSARIDGGDLSEGARGAAVEKLQTTLEEKGFLAIPAGVAKGYFGALTKSAVMKYQQSLGVTNTGYYGPLTRSAMKAMMMKKDGAMMKKDDAMMKKDEGMMKDKTMTQ